MLTEGVGATCPDWAVATFCDSKNGYTAAGVKLQSDSVDETTRLAVLFGEEAHAGGVLGLIGDLGAGKTFFVQALARGLGVPKNVRVTSPTFTLLNEYRGGRLTLFHADLYRLNAAGELAEIGIDEVFDQGGVTCVEWSSRFPLLPTDRLEMNIRGSGDEPRELLIQAHGSVSREWLARIERRL